jgi:hypothetical protein
MSRKPPIQLLVLVLFCVVAIPAVAPGFARAATRTLRTSGVVSGVGGNYLTIKRPGRARGVIAAMDGAADRLTRANYPYVWGGGHGQAGVASVGQKGGPGHNGKRRGFDCSGSIAAVLVAGGIWPQGSGVPSDAGVIAYLRSAHLIARGAGRGPNEVTLYDDPGVHIFMNIDGRFFGTSDGGGSAGDPKGGPGWLYDGAPDASSRHFRRWHVLPSALRARTTAGLMLTFALGSQTQLLAGLSAGQQVSVTYVTSNLGTLVARSVSVRGSSGSGPSTSSGSGTSSSSGTSPSSGTSSGSGSSAGSGAGTTATSARSGSGSSSGAGAYTSSPTGGGSGVSPRPVSGGGGL